MWVNQEAIGQVTVAFTNEASESLERLLAGQQDLGAYATAVTRDHALVDLQSTNPGSAAPSRPPTASSDHG